MRDTTMSRRGMWRATLALLAGFGAAVRGRAVAAPAELKVPDGVPVERVYFETKGIEGWTTVGGQWAVEDVAGAPSGRRALVPRATRHAVHVSVAPVGPDCGGGVSWRVEPGTR